MTDQQIAKWIDQLQGELDTLKRTAGSGGSTVTITPTLQSGEKVADYSIDGTEGAIYVPDIYYYSTNERLVGEWIDGSDVFEKTFYLAAATEADVLVADLTSLNIANIVAMEGIASNAAGQTITLPYAYYGSLDYTVTILYSTQSKELQMRCGSGSRNLSDIYITVRYIKTSTSNTDSKKVRKK